MSEILNAPNREGYWWTRGVVPFEHDPAPWRMLRVVRPAAVAKPDWFQWKYLDYSGGTNPNGGEWCYCEPPSGE